MTSTPSIEPALTCPHIDRLRASGVLPPEAIAELDAIREINSQLRYGKWHETARAEASESTVERLTRELEQAREALREMGCPRPCNSRPDDTTVGQCVGFGECGCGADKALEPHP